MRDIRASQVAFVLKRLIEEQIFVSDGLGAVVLKDLAGEVERISNTLTLMEKQPITGSWRPLRRRSPRNGAPCRPDPMLSPKTAFCLIGRKSR